MKITDIQFEKAEFRFAEPMKVAFGTLAGYHTLVLRMVTDEGICGLGEAAPLGFVTGDNIDTALAIGKEFRAALLGENPIQIARIHSIMDSMYAYNTSVKAGIDIACYDIASKKMGLPLYQYLGGFNPEFFSDVTIGMDEPEKMAQKSEQWVEKGWRHLKIKLGEDAPTDAARMQAIRQAVGPDIILRVDANQGWSVKEAVRMAKELALLDVELIEQPVVHWDYSGLRTVKEQSALPIVADESCHSPMDAARLMREHVVDGINIKLMKCGGIYKAQKINAIAEASNAFCMLGCMGESRISNVAAMHLGAASPNIKIIDLDVTFYTHNPDIQGGYTNTGGYCRLLDEPGIGVTLC